MNEKIHELVMNEINSGCNENVLSELIVDTPVNQYKVDTAIRFLKTYRKYQDKKVSKEDLECSLRNYLLLMKTDIILSNYEASENYKLFGLSFDNDTNRFWVNTSLPKYVNGKLIKQLYMQNISNRNVNKNVSLSTNAYIKELTGFSKFKSMEQKLAVMGSLKTPHGYTTLVSMSTGGGKSLVTQSVAYQSRGLTIVIVPTISLMINQCNNAKKIINSENVENEIFCYYSGKSLKEFIDALKNEQAKLLFVSPESLIKNKELRNAILEANSKNYLKNLIIDEAHIVIEWGSAFRIDFQCIDAFRKALKRENDGLRTFLLSATYSKDTIIQLKNIFSEQDNWIEIRCDKLRKEIRYDIIKASNYREKKHHMYDLIRLLPHPMILYVKSPDDAEKISEELNDIGFQNFRTFTGRTSSEAREQVIQEWIDDEFDLMIATCAFGVGVDKKDVRTVLHTYIPENPNKYYQEAGRGGRDGLPCLSTVLYIDEDVDSAFSLVSKVLTVDKISGRWFSMLNSGNTVPLLNGKYNIDTYTKPSYNESEIYLDSISGRDVDWNVYVILLLRRSGLLKIDDVNYDNGKYNFFVTILNRDILRKNDKAEAIFEKIREIEWKKNEKDFLLMKKNLYNTKRVCWSSMFNKVYTLTNEYCAGCNQHDDVLDFEDNWKTLKIDIDVPLSRVDERINKYTYGSQYLLVIEKNDTAKVIKNMINSGADVLVANSETIENCIFCVEDDIDANSNIVSYEYNEFFDLITSNKFFASGAIIIHFPENVLFQNKILNIINYNKADEITYIIISSSDFYLQNRNKYLSEVVPGLCRQEF